MSVYQFAPSPDKSTNESLYAWWENGFSNREIKDIISIGEDYLPDTSATLDSGNVDEDVRKSKVSWISQNSRTSFLYDRMAFIARQLNGQFFDFDLYGFVEDFQYTVYGPENDHYTWHMDKGKSTSTPRKLSLVLMLSDPSEYDGGDLEIWTGNQPRVLDKTKGTVHAFPSFVMHRVTPVTRGIRRTVVIWIAGPKFK
jgi:PKHD-type hydroxylase